MTTGAQDGWMRACRPWIVVALIAGAASIAVVALVRNRRKLGVLGEFLEFALTKWPFSHQGQVNRDPLLEGATRPEPKRRDSAALTGKAPQWIVDFAEKYKNVAFTTEDARRVSRKFKTPLTQDIIEEREQGR